MQLSQTGPGPARELVLCHGLASSIGYWPVEMLESLRRHFRLTLFDQRGHGRSRPTDNGYDPAGLGADLAALIAERNLDRPHILAHSYGGVAALAMLSQSPDAARSLVLLDSQIGLGRTLAAEAGDGMDASLTGALTECGIDIDPTDPFAGIHLITRLAERQVSDRPVESDDSRVQFLAQSIPPAKARRWLSLVNGTGAIAEMTRPDGLSEADLRRLTLPVLALYGETSASMHTGRLLSGILSQCRFDVIEGAGHFFVTSRASEISARCLAFWGVADAADRAGAA